MTKNTLDNRATIEAVYRVTTPMFCGGADQQAELRVASFKGALRFWWRSLMWGQLKQQAKGDSARALSLLKAREDNLFGSTGRRSLVQTRLKWKGKKPLESELVHNWPANRPPVGSTYLGYGITESGRRGNSDHKSHRIGLPNDREFVVSCYFQRQMPNEDREAFCQALQLLGLVGGLGSRSRRAFGSVALVELNGDSCVVSSLKEYRQRISACAGAASIEADLPPYTAFSSHTRIAFLPPETDVFKAHEELGERFRAFRGQPGPHRGMTKRPLGLPLKGDVKELRRSSPIFLHVHPVETEFVGVVLFVPAKFHPDIPEGDILSFYRIATNWMEELKGEVV